MAQGLYSNYPQDRVCVKGNASEIARVRFRVAEGEKVTARTLSKYSTLTFPHQKEMEKNPFVNRAWEEWLLNLNDLHNVHILDLFYWEHWAGNFAAMTQAEFDIVQEVFTPYNCRNFLTNMLSVDEKYRDHDEPILYKKLILKLWPEVLSEPVNPQEKRRKKQKIRPMIKKLLVNMHVYEPLKNALSRYR